MKRILSISVLILLTALIGCSENALEPPTGKERKSEATSHNYYLMKGSQVSKKFCYISNLCDTGELLESDTLQTSFLVEVDFPRDKPDTVLFSGLEGVDIRVSEMYPGFNGGTTANPFCEVDYDCAYAQKTGDQLKFDRERPGGDYSGKGTLNNDVLTLETEYYYRGSGAEYYLEGEKVNLNEGDNSSYETIIVSGEKITTTYSDWPIPEGDKPSVDTSRTGFIFARQLDDDQFRIIGLDGADVGKRGNQVFPNCPDNGECVIMGNTTGSDGFEVNLNNNGRTYSATANFGTSGFEMEAEYNYQNVKIKYDLLGEWLY